MKRVKILIVIILGISMMGLIFGKQQKLRPLKLKVIDEATKEPLKGIKVYHILEVAYVKKKVLLFIPSPSPRTIRRIVIAKEYLTDGNGEVNIDEQIVELKRKEEFYMECIAVNIDINDDAVQKMRNLSCYREFYKEEIEKFGKAFWFYNNMEFYSVDFEEFHLVNKKYRGYYIMTGYAHLNPDVIRDPHAIRSSGYGHSLRDKMEYRYVDMEVEWAKAKPAEYVIPLKLYDPQIENEYKKEKMEMRLKFVKEYRDMAEKARKALEEREKK